MSWTTLVELSCPTKITAASVVRTIHSYSVILSDAVQTIIDGLERTTRLDRKNSWKRNHFMCVACVFWSALTSLIDCMISMTVEIEPLPYAPTFVRPDVGRANPKMGVADMIWSPTGKWLACHNRASSSSHILRP
jgi:hypothetical protein